MTSRRSEVGLLRPRLAAAVAAAPEERALAGKVSGGFYFAGGLTLALSAVVPGVEGVSWMPLLVVAGGAAAWGLLSAFAIDWERAPSALVLVSSTAAFGVIAAAIASSGGARSPAWIYLFFVDVFAAYFYRPVLAFAYMVGCVLTHGSMLLWSHAAPGGTAAQFVVASPSYFVLGAAIIAGKRLMLSTHSRAEQLAAEQGALRRVATAVVSGEPPERFYATVAYEIACLLGCGAAGILRLETPTETMVMGSWADHEGGRYEAGTIVPVRPGSDVAHVLSTCRPVRIDQHPVDSPVGRLGYGSSIVAPVHVDAGIWGVLAVSRAQPGQFTTADEQRLTAFGDLLSTAITSIEDRAKLASQASTDPLTGLANHRTFRERLVAEVARGVRHRRPASVAVIDIDHFKQINDLGGHEAGDETLLHVARCLSSLARTEDTLGRLGGDEFAWVLPECTRTEAFVAVERARELISESLPGTTTVSAGICDTAESDDAAELIALADGALYWSKAHGRNQCWVYDRTVISELSAQQRAERLERSRALVGLRALARAIDAKDPATSEHSERVSELVGRLARVSGWSPERALLLSQAALVHDVGKIGVPDALLRKLGRLTDSEFDQIKTHAELSARIVEDVLLPEQVVWIRGHHERPDGNGYPCGLPGHQIAEGSALLAIADAWDVMTVSRPYSIPKQPDAALEECIELTGSQFTATAVAALQALQVAGELDDELAIHG